MGLSTLLPASWDCHRKIVPWVFMVKHCSDPKTKGKSKVPWKMSFSCATVTDTCTGRGEVEDLHPRAGPPRLAPGRQAEGPLALCAFTSGESPCSLEGQQGGPRVWRTREDTAEPVLFISLGSQGEGGEPRGGAGQNTLLSFLSPSSLGFFSAHPSWAASGGQCSRRCRGDGLLA